MKLILSPSAILDLQSIADYTLQTWGEEQETLYLKGLWRKLEEIRACPESYRMRNDLVIGCRSAGHGKHVIFFQIQEGSVRVLRILHRAKDFDSHLPDEMI